MTGAQRLCRRSDVFHQSSIAVLNKSDSRHWGYYYARGTSYERLKNWPAAEADLKRALALAPDQPLILNYLGYSWVDQGKNLKEGMRLIEKAVQLKPDDGYIVDSLGWAHYKQGNFKEAVRFLERAVEIKPEDPTLNDHLGDAFWKVGREREARFQWSQALSLEPEPEDVDKIKAKLERGLDSKGEAKNVEKTRQVQSDEAIAQAQRKQGRDAAGQGRGVTASGAKSSDDDQRAPRAPVFMLLKAVECLCRNRNSRPPRST